MLVPFSAPYDLTAADYARTMDGDFVPVEQEMARRALERKRKPGIKQSHFDLYDAFRWPIVRKGDLVGCSDGTDEKCEQVLWLFKRQVSICGRMAAKYNQRCLLLDTNCGPGGFVWEPETGNRFGRTVIRGTPLQFLRAVRHDPLSSMWTAAFIDLQQRHCDDLSRRIEEWRAFDAPTLPIPTEILSGDNTVLAPYWVNQHFGLHERPYGFVVHDANNGVDPDLVERLGELPQLQRVDFLLYVPAAQFKWHKKDLLKILEGSKKTRWLLGPVLRDHWQHLWMIGTCWDKDAGYPKRDVVPWDSPQGQRRWDVITKTRAARAA